MADVSEHDSNKKSKGYDIEWCRIDLMIRRNTIRVHNLLWHLQHTVAIEFTWRHFVTLDQVQS